MNRKGLGVGLLVEEKIRKGTGGVIFCKKNFWAGAQK